MPIKHLAVFTLATATLGAATVPRITAVVNAAGYQAEIVSGSWATILGSGLSNTTRAWMTSDFVNGQLPPELDYISVTVNGRPAYVGYVSPTQINVLIPDDTSVGTATVQAAGQLLQSNIFVANKVAYSPALFPFRVKYPAAEHLDGTLVGPPGLLAGATTIPAKSGETIQVFGTGFGASVPAIATGIVFSAAVQLAQPVTATVGGASAKVAAYLIGPGLYQLNVTMPALPNGDAAVVFTIGGVATQSGMFVNIAN